MAKKPRNFKVIVSNANLTKNAWLLSADNHYDALLQMNWLFVRLNYCLNHSMTRRRLRGVRRAAHLGVHEYKLFRPGILGYTARMRNQDDAIVIQVINLNYKKEEALRKSRRYV